VKAELPLPKQTFQSVAELAPENCAQHTDGKKETGSGTNPARVIGSETARRDDAVDMRVMLQVLTPRMKNGKKADLSAEVLGVGSNFEQRLCVSGW
jgi:hypothetical protein